MSNGRHLTAWLLLGLLTVVGAGGAVLGVVQSPKTASLDAAVANTLAAPNYTEVLTEVTRRGTRPTTSSTRPPIVWAATSRAGASAPTLRLYHRPARIPERHRVLQCLDGPSVLLQAGQPGWRQAERPGPAVPHLCHPQEREGQSREHLHVSNQRTHPQGGTETGILAYTVSGQYISEFSLSLPQGSVKLDRLPGRYLPTGGPPVRRQADLGLAIPGEAVGGSSGSVRLARWSRPLDGSVDGQT